MKSTNDKSDVIIMRGNKNVTPKFPIGSKVAVCKEMPSYMAHFDSGFNAIVEYTYAQKYGGDDIDSYSLIVLDENDNPINSISWYRENQLTLISDDLVKGKEIIKRYEFG